MRLDNESNGNAITLNQNYTTHLLLLFQGVGNIDINTIGREGYNIWNYYYYINYGIIMKIYN